MKEWRKQDIFKVIVTTLLISITLAMFLPFYSEILLAAIFAFAIEPTLGRLLRARHLRWKMSVAGILAAMFLLLAGPISLVAYKAYIYFLEISKTGFQNTELFKKMVNFRAHFLQFANHSLTVLHLDNDLNLSGISEDAIGKIGTLIVQTMTGFVYHIPEVMLSLFVFCVALYFFLAEARTVKLAFLRLHFVSASEAQKLIAVLQKSSFNTVVTSLALGFLAASMVACGAWLLEGGDFTVVFVITFFCSFVPIIGAGPVALALGLYKLVTGQGGEALGFLVVAIAVGIIDNLVRPYLISSNEEDLHPVVSLLALIGALVIFGMPGVFLGPVIASVAMKVIPIFYPATNVIADATDPA